MPSDARAPLHFVPDLDLVTQLCHGVGISLAPQAAGSKHSSSEVACTKTRVAPEHSAQHAGVGLDAFLPRKVSPLPFSGGFSLIRISAAI